jgi:hypothetical protein
VQGVLQAANGILDLALDLIGAAFGPMQVAARVVEYVFAPHLRAVTVGRIAFVLMAAALLTLSAVDGQRWLAFGFALLYGASNGILTIVRGTLPEIFTLFNKKLDPDQVRYPVIVLTDMLLISVADC